VSEQYVEREQRVTTPLELFFDLVLVFGFTQVTTVLPDDPTWSGLGHGLLILAALWWAWASYAWLTNAVDPGEGAFQLDRECVCSWSRRPTASISTEGLCAMSCASTARSM
jgi:low temperature requirement protein LtrA